MKKLNIGIIGIGKISGIYLDNLTTKFTDCTKVTALCDTIKERATEAAEKYSIKKVLTIEELLKDSDIDIVLNLTTPQFHFDICKQALLQGKHVYVEKPLSLTYDQAKELVDLAKEKNLRLGGAPDTFLGAGIQTCIKLLNDGWIGKPVAASAFMMNHGHESWHPDPGFYYKKGGGPLFDMGPYYLTALISLLGPANRLCASTKQTFDTRLITSEELNGTTIDVEVPTHISGIVDFKCGATVNLTTSFDIWHHSMPHIEIYGTEGSLRVPDPNTFGGPIFVRRKTDETWTELPLLFDNCENSRGIGLVDMAKAIIENTPHKANGNMLLHVVEIMCGMHEASEKSVYYTVKSDC